MSTRATISYVDNHKIYTIYCHFDGYIKGVGTLLATFYTTLEKVTELVSNGDASYIAEHINPDPTYEHSFNNPQDNVCVFYHRDRNEPWEHTKPYISDFNETTLSKVMGMQDYNYIFMNNEWYVHRRGDVGIYELTEDIVKNGLPYEEEEYMRILCNHCNKSFNFTNVPKYCPFCGSDSLERNNKKQKERALKLIAEYNEITTKMESFIDEYITSSKRIKEIRHELATYKTRGIITADELPYTKNENLMSFIKRRIQEKESED